MSTWRLVRSGVPEVLVLGPVLFVSDKDSEMEQTLSKFATDTKLCCVDDMLEGRDAILRDPVWSPRAHDAELMFVTFNSSEFQTAFLPVLTWVSLLFVISYV